MKFKEVSDTIDFGSCSLKVLQREERKGEPHEWELLSPSLPISPLPALDPVSPLPALPPNTPRFHSSLEKEHRLRMEEFLFRVKQVYMKFQKRGLETVILCARGVGRENSAASRVKAPVVNGKQSSQGKLGSHPKNTHIPPAGGF